MSRYEHFLGQLTRPPHFKQQRWIFSSPSPSLFVLAFHTEPYSILRVKHCCALVVRGNTTILKIMLHKTSPVSKVPSWYCFFFSSTTCCKSLPSFALAKISTYTAYFAQLITLMLIISPLLLQLWKNGRTDLR